MLIGSMLAKGTTFGTPITEMYPKFWFAYVDGPEIKSAAGGKIKYAFIEGPDKIRIELVEGQAHKE
jgi:hypothetical protein